VLVFAGLATLLFAVSEGESLGWTSPIILGMLVVSALALCGFVLHELRIKSPLLELRLFANGNFLRTNLIMMLVFFSFSGINYLLPFYLQYVGGYDTSTAGLVLTSLSVAMMVAGIVSGMLFNRIGARLLAIGAGAFLVSGYFMVTTLRVDTAIGFVVLCLTVIGFGLGLIISPVSNMIMNSVSKSHQGMVSSLLSLERFAPMTIGIAVFNLVFIQGILTIAARHEVTESAPAEIIRQVLTAGFDLAFILTFLLGIVILILAIFAREEIHPDYLTGEREEEPVAGML
jgi:MFS family permease